MSCSRLWPWGPALMGVPEVTIFSAGMNSLFPRGSQPLASWRRGATRSETIFGDLLFGQKSSLQNPAKGERNSRVLVPPALTPTSGNIKEGPRTREDRPHVQNQLERAGRPHRYTLREGEPLQCLIVTLPNPTVSSCLSLTFRQTYVLRLAYLQTYLN